MKTKIALYILAVAASAAVLCSCTETLSVEEVRKNAPEIESFSPVSAPIGTVVTVKGKYLNNVYEVKIGGTVVPLYERVSDTQISFTATGDATSGKITVTNTYGSTTSTDNFTYSYAVPELISSALPSEVEMGGLVLLSGNNFNAVRGVFFTAEGHSAHQAAIKNQNDTELLVKVPYVESSSAKITLSYNNGSGEVYTSSDSAPSLTIIRHTPTVTTTVFARTAVGSAVTLEGDNLDKIESVKVGGFAAVIGTKTANSISFAVPAGNFADGDNLTDIVISYFDGNETQTITDNFIAYVPKVKYWEGMKVWGQGRDVEEFASFFSPETGLVYNNSVWRTSVDPVSYQYQASNCSAANTPASTKAEYDSVNPYFFFSGVSSGALQLNGPANSNSQLKNFYFANNSANEYRVTGSNGSCYGTPVIRYRYLDPSNPAEKTIIDKVVGKQIEVIDEQSFPIDVTASTVAGVGITSASGGIQSGVWCKAYTVPSAYTSDVVTVTGDMVIMILYYDHSGSASGSNFAEHIKRIGFIHITKVNFRLYNSTVAPSSSDITFNCYWQKYDYDYNKL